MPLDNPFHRAATALDLALLANPVFMSERGLTHRRVKIESSTAIVLRAYFDACVAEGSATREAVDAILAGVPEVPK